MDKRNPDVVVVGGAAGAVIAHKLAERGKRVALLCRNDVSGATDTNQKWLHSGLLYPARKLAATAWRNRNDDWEIKGQYLKGPQQAYILALNEQTVIERTSMWAEWRKEGHEIPGAEPLTPNEKTHLRDAGISFADGWTTPDCAIDFPGMVRDLRLHLAGKLPHHNHLPALKESHCVMEGARVLRLRRGRNGITGVDFEWNGDQSTISCEQCVLAAGAWSYELLLDMGVRLPLIRKKCLVLVVKPEALP